MTATLLKRTWQAFNEDKALSLSSAIAYATIFSIVPLLIVLIAIAGWFLGVAHTQHGHSQAEAALLGLVSHGAGAGTAETVRQLVATSFDKPQHSVIAQVVGWITFAIGASGLFVTLQDAFNAVWHVQRVGGGWRYAVRSRLASFGMVAVAAFLLLVTLLLTSVSTAIAVHFAHLVPLAGGAALVNALSWLVSLAVSAVVFALMFAVLPSVRIAWKDVWIGALVTAVLFVIGQVMIALYLSLAGVASGYGAAGSILVALIWVYYSAATLLFGAEFTKVRAAHAATTAPAAIGTTAWHPPGVDPRAVQPEEP